MNRRFHLGYPALGFVVLAILIILATRADARVLGLLENTLLLAVGTCAVSLPLGTLLAVLVIKTDAPGRRVLGLLVVAMLLVPLYLQAAAWLAGFGQQGWFTLAYQGRPLLDGWAGAIWIHAMAAVPWVALVVGAGLWVVEPELEEDALLDGSAARVFGRVTLRRVAGAVLLAGVWVAVITAGEIAVTDLLMIRTYAEEVYTEINLGGLLKGTDEFEIQPSSGGLWPGVAVTAVLVAAGLAVCRRLAPDMVDSGARRPLVWRLGTWRWLAGVTAWALAAVMVAIPVGNLVYKAGVVVAQSEAGRVREWSMAKTVSLVAKSPAAHGQEIVWSLLIGATAASVAVAIAVGLAWLATARRERGLTRWALPALALAAVGLAVPGPIVGLVVVQVFNAMGSDTPVWLAYLYDRTIAPPVLAQVVRCVPLAVLILWHALWTIPREVIESARCEGALWWGQLFRIVLPSRWPAVLLAWLVCLAVCLSELAATVLVVPPGIRPLSVHVFGLLHYGVEDQVAAICLLLIGCFWLATLAVYAVGVRRVLRRR